MTDLPVNHFKSRLLEGECQFGLWLGLPDPTAAEICAQAPFDWLLIDAEHAPFSLEKIQELLRTLAPYAPSPIVRPVSDDKNLIKQYLDIGAQTLLIPMVETPQQAQALVDAVHYPPKGVRGVGTSLARAARWNNVPDYLHRADEEICLLIQIETAAGLDNLDAICAVEGVDGIFFGPSDLSASLGFPGDAGNPEVVSRIEQAIAAVTHVGKKAGLLCLDLKLKDRYINAGASFVGVGVDTLLLGQGAKKLAAQVAGEQAGGADSTKSDPVSY